MKIFIVLFIFAAFQAGANAKRGRCYPVTEPPVVTVLPPTCPKNEEYSECGANGCQATCANPNLPKVCRAMCVSGCICKSGFIRNDQGECVNPKKCPVQSCPANEYYTDCGTACPLTCSNYQNPPTICTKNCVAGCFCNKGFVRNENGKCVKPSQCPVSECPANEYFTDCGTACPLTCSNYQNPEMLCTQNCVVGCFCNEGYVRNENGKCVKPSKCPVPECPANEEYSSCNAYCQRTCGPPTPCARPPQDCNPGCVCKSGYIRSQHGGKCIPDDKCPEKCPANEIHSPCGAHPACQHTCDTYGSPLKCPKICKPGCICDEGFVRNSKGVCVKIEECPKKCPRNEVYSECGANSCQMFCRWYYNPDKYACRPVCTEGCICEEGLIRNSNGICVAPKQCSKQDRIW